MGIVWVRYEKGTGFVVENESWMTKKVRID